MGNINLRPVLTQHSAQSHAYHQVCFVTPAHDRRVIQWLTKADAHNRAQKLRKRGYRGVAVSTMPV